MFVRMNDKWDILKSRRKFFDATLNCSLSRMRIFEDANSNVYYFGENKNASCQTDSWLSLVESSSLLRNRRFQNRPQVQILHYPPFLSIRFKKTHLTIMDNMEVNSMNFSLMLVGSK
jgi:hypothetical protein